MPIKASTSNCIWEISLETSGPGASVGAQLLIWSHPADFAREKRGSWDLRAGCFDCIPLHVCSRCDFGSSRFPLLLKGSFFLSCFCLSHTFSRTVLSDQYELCDNSAVEMSFPQLGYPQYLSASQAVYGSERPGVLTPSSRGGSTEIAGSPSATAAAVTSVLGMYANPYAHNYSAFLPYTSADLALFSQMVRIIVRLCFLFMFVATENCLWSMAPPLHDKITKTIPDNHNKYSVVINSKKIAWYI